MILTILDNMSLPFIILSFISSFYSKNWYSKFWISVKSFDLCPMRCSRNYCRLWRALYHFFIAFLPSFEVCSSYFFSFSGFISPFVGLLISLFRFFFVYSTPSNINWSFRGRKSSSNFFFYMHFLRVVRSFSLLKWFGLKTNYFPQPTFFLCFLNGLSLSYIRSESVLFDFGDWGFLKKPFSFEVVEFPIYRSKIYS